MTRRWSLFVCFLAALGVAASDYPVTPAPFSAVQVTGGFWKPRLDTNRTITIPYDFKKCEETGRIRNFAVAGGLEPGEFKGIFFDDSDVYKVIEGASYSLSMQPDPALDAYLDELILKIAAAQEDDGYLYTYRTCNQGNPDKVAKDENLRDGRWAHLQYDHELYNVGHLYEAAVAHFQATGKRALLEVALKNADLVCSVFGPGRRIDVPGHQEIEIGLAKLYRVTGDGKYLDQAKFFLDARGSKDRAQLFGEYQQDHVPVLQQEQAVGHAVRAGYMYAGMADVAALTGDSAYVNAIERLWTDVVSTKLYVTGGIGARREGEAFGAAYELPNAKAYNETCADIALALWNYRMFLFRPDAKYVDVIERVIYNGFLSGVGMSGDCFFYPNPLETDGKAKFNHGSAERQPWFGCSCCPTNVVRFLPTLLGWTYAQQEGAVYVNLFLESETRLEHASGPLSLKQETRYPWDGAVRLTVSPAQPSSFPVRVRIPGWTRNQPVPSDLYRNLMDTNEPARLFVNDTEVEVQLRDGYAEIVREWKAGDVIRLDMPMPVRRVVAHEQVVEDRGKVALERGPLVYCFEGVDNDGEVISLMMRDQAAVHAEERPDLLGGITVLRGEAIGFEPPVQGETPGKHVRSFTAIPYYAWGHRGAQPMAVWIPREDKAVRYQQAVLSSSHCFAADSVEAAMDGMEPNSSNDQNIPRLTWWDHQGTEEWLEIQFKAPRTVSGLDVYWFDDTGGGACRVPARWQVASKSGDEWTPVQATGAYPVNKDAYSAVSFAPVKTGALRVYATLQAGFSGGILEVKLK